jgi:Tfp pilus assembly protein PilF
MDTRGLVLLQASDVDGAVAILSRAASSDVAPPETQIHLAQALIRRGDDTAAKAVLTQTLAAPDAAAQHRAAAILLQKLEP